MVKIFMLYGFHGSGKDTLCRLIIEKYPNFKRYAFADTAKDIASKRYNFDRKLADIPEEKDKSRPEYNGQSIRDLVRKIFREIDTTDINMITNEIAKSIASDINTNHDTKFIITDYREKANYLKLVEIFGKNEITTIHITRDNLIIPDSIKEPEEHKLLKCNFSFDITINNSENKPKLMLDQFENAFQICRICLDDDTVKNLISPCLCNGTAKFVHLKCLNQWRHNSQTQLSTSQCDLCKYHYEYNDYMHPVFLILVALLVNLYKFLTWVCLCIFISMFPPLLVFYINDNTEINILLWCISNIILVFFFVIVACLFKLSSLKKITTKMIIVIVTIISLPFVPLCYFNEKCDIITCLCLYVLCVFFSYVLSLSKIDVISDMFFTYNNCHIANTIIRNR